MPPYAKIIKDRETLGHTYHLFVADDIYPTLEEAQKNTSSASNVEIIDLENYQVPQDPELCEHCKKELQMLISREIGR